MSNECAVIGCSLPAITRGWCQAHYKRWGRHGDPLGGRSTMEGDPQKYFRDIALTYEGNECLTWPFSKNSAGYGHIWHDGAYRFVHRLVCEHVNDPSPTPKHEAAHSCGNGHLACCTKAHLSWKTRAGNAADMISHGTVLRGERHARSKLTEAAVLEIRALRGIVAIAELASRFNVHYESVARIQRRESWGWL